MKKKIDKNFAFSTKNIAKEFINSPANRYFCCKLYQLFKFEICLPNVVRIFKESMKFQPHFTQNLM
jgi:hypothetical protein